MVFQLTSPAFDHKGLIPSKYTCKGEDVSPALNWNNPPADTLSYGLIMDDPDAPVGTWVHWVIYNIPSTRNMLPESVPSEWIMDGLGVNGTNSWKKAGYGGPCPPLGSHRYFFRLYALSKILELGPGANKPELIKAMQGHILATAELMGVFSK